MLQSFERSSPAFIVAVYLFIAFNSISCAAPALTFDTDKTGLALLAYNGENMLADGRLFVQSVGFGGPGLAVIDGSSVPVATSYDSGAKAVMQSYDWGTLICKYSIYRSRLNLTVTVHNSSPSTLAQITLHVLSLHFPAAPLGWSPNYAYIGSNLGDPTIEVADYGTGEAAVCNDDVIGEPLLVGFPGRSTLIDRPVVISTTPGWYMTPYLDQRIARPIESGAADTYHISVRFAPSATPAMDVGSDLLREIAKTYPAELKWKDRRPIGTLHLATSDDAHHSKSNPSGWLLDPTGIDVTTESGRIAFRQKMLAYADNSIKLLKSAGAQGMIVWDIEGEAHGNVTYYGDPRQIRALAPEMDSCADEFFKKFADAGLRTGVCVRPQDLIGVGTSKITQSEILSSNKIIDLLYSKITYANARWGCSLFYIDSNGDPNVPYDVGIFKSLLERLHSDRVDVLLVPEHKTLRYFAYAAPYAELRLGYVDTPPIVRSVYPNAFECNYIPDGPVDEQRDALIAAVKAGQVLMFRGWWPDPYTEKLKDIYASVGSK